MGWMNFGFMLVKSDKIGNMIPYGILFWIMNKWVFPKIGVPQNGWFKMENPIKMDDLGGTTIFGNTQIDYRLFWKLIWPDLWPSNFRWSAPPFAMRMTMTIQTCGRHQLLGFRQTAGPKVGRWQWGNPRDLYQLLSLLKWTGINKNQLLRER